MGIDRFLIVDEVEANVLFFDVALAELGYKAVKTATSGPAAIDIFAKQNSQFVIAAWEMQQMPGTVLMQRLKADRRRQLPYLLYSKRMSEQDLQLTRDLGINNILSMPLDREKVKSEIKRIITAEDTMPREETLLRKIEGYIAEGKPNEALQLLDGKLKAKGPYFARAHSLLGQIWTLAGQLPKAEEALKIALEADPALTDAAGALATVYSRTGRHDLAIAQLQTMTQKSPKNISAMLNLGSAYVEADRMAEAKQTFGMVSAIDPDCPPLKDEQAKMAFKEGDLPLAAQLLAETQNGDALARHFNNLAIGLTHQQKYEQAIDTYQNAIKLLLTKGKVHALRYNLGLALAKKGELNRSFGELAASYKGDPSFEKAYAALARVSKLMTEKGESYDKNLAREVNLLHKQMKPPQAS